MGGIDGTAAVKPGSYPPTLLGSLVNNSGYDLEQVEIVVHTPAAERGGAGVVIFAAGGGWPRGKTIDLAADATLKMEGRGSR